MALSEEAPVAITMDLDNEGELAMDNSDSPVRLKPGFFGYATVHVNE